MVGAFPGPTAESARKTETGKKVVRSADTWNTKLSAGLGTAFRRAATRIVVEVDVAAFRRVGFLAGN